MRAAVDLERVAGVLHHSGERLNLFFTPFWFAIYHLVWATKLLLAAIGLVSPALVLGYKSFNCSMYHLPVPTLIEKFV
jgi:hypothetical protein